MSYMFNSNVLKSHYVIYLLLRIFFRMNQHQYGVGSRPAL